MSRGDVEDRLLDMLRSHDTEKEREALRKEDTKAVELTRNEATIEAVFNIALGVVGGVVQGVRTLGPWFNANAKSLRITGVDEVLSRGGYTFKSAWKASPYHAARRLRIMAVKGVALAGLFSLVDLGMRHFRSRNDFINKSAAAFALTGGANHFLGLSSDRYLPLKVAVGVAGTVALMDHYNIHLVKLPEYNTDDDDVSAEFGTSDPRLKANSPRSSLTGT